MGFAGYTIPHPSEDCIHLRGFSPSPPFPLLCVLSPSPSFLLLNFFFSFLFSFLFFLFFFSFLFFSFLLLSFLFPVQTNKTEEVPTGKVMKDSFEILENVFEHIMTEFIAKVEAAE